MYVIQLWIIRRSSQSYEDTFHGPRSLQKFINHVARTYSVCLESPSAGVAFRAAAAQK